MTSRADKRKAFLDALIATGKSEVSLSEVKDVAENAGLAIPYWFTNDETNKVKRGVYRVPNASGAAPAISLAAQVIPLAKVENSSGNRIANVTTDLEIENLVPSQYDNYVPFGNFEDVLSIVKSKQFFPVFITGQSGNGKTMSIEQACAKAKRKFICVSMTPDSDEGDLLGNYVLINGQMEWRDGPVTVAARQGAVLCIDEIDYGAQNLSCLQRVLEGKPFLLKKKNELVVPAPGFTVFATANTKGKGSEDGRYMFTNVLNEAFLERFPNTMEQEFPPARIEEKIVNKELDSVGRSDETFAKNLVTWANTIRNTFADGGCDEVISTRRLVHIVKTFGIYGDKKKAIEYCLNRFDADTKITFLDLYTKIDAGIDPNEPAATEQVEPVTTSDEQPF
jgi:AAA domain (dynein-related subfamily)/CbbQ/NirQ/NorQ C-terminal